MLAHRRLASALAVGLYTVQRLPSPFGPSAVRYMGCLQRRGQKKVSELSGAALASSTLPTKMQWAIDYGLWSYDIRWLPVGVFVARATVIVFQALRLPRSVLCLPRAL
jgi:hypothetical protein